MSLNDLALSDFYSNPTPRLPIMLCLDTSWSMNDRMTELNAGVELFYKEVYENEIAQASAEIALIKIGGDASLIKNFKTLEEDDLKGSNLQANGVTPLKEGVEMALDLLEQRKIMYKSAGISYYQPWLVIMSDGAPTDQRGNILKDSDLVGIHERLKELANTKKLVIFAIGIGQDVDMRKLQIFSPNRPVVRLKGNSFSNFFEWLSASVDVVSNSNPGDLIKLDVSGMKSWGEL